MDMSQLHNTITEIRVELGKLSTRLERLDEFTRRLDDLHRRLDDVEGAVTKAVESTKSAHLRLNGIGKVGFWLLTAIGGAAIVFVVGFAMRGGFNI
ncbi:hypothetical protein PA598K_01324 [Paenibacillus sp. 598K]|uniref:hemolysin XhlA family protein n=1 Tax=Paenibacillus sp. 598K TaxID=1117987 RepID=UPI000FF92DC1|nr:hemolysin XhlA family protein [Paenibacillus sp. 598K]GBF73039.1 hypothetical protein PA598K_01324 [Paenibacillus sp. 598K]